MSDRDGYWDSDWDPEVGIDPPEDFDGDIRDLYEDYEPSDDECQYIVVYRFRGIDEYVLLSDLTWASIHSYQVGGCPPPTGILGFGLDQKWVAEILANHFTAYARKDRIPIKTVPPKEKFSYEELMDRKKKVVEHLKERYQFRVADQLCLPDNIEQMDRECKWEESHNALLLEQYQLRRQALSDDALP